MKIIICTTIFLLATSLAYATPNTLSLNSNIANDSDGNSFVISGADFGTKTTAAPLLFDDFEAGSDGTQLDTSSDWTAYSGDGALYSNTIARSGTLSAYNDPSARGGFLTCYTTFASSYDEIFISYWWKLVNADTDDYGIVKLSRITSSAAAGGGGVYNGTGDTALSNYNPTYEGGCYLSYNNGSDSTIVGYDSPPNDTWTNIQMYKKLSTAGSSDGVIFSDYIADTSVLSDSSAETRASGQTFKLDSVMLGLMAANVEGNGFQMYIDDIYIDNTLARVEIGNASVLTNCTKRIMQIPSAWATDEITFTCKLQDATPASENWYLFVIDSDGNASDGLLVSSGAGGGDEPDTTPPSLGAITPADGSTNQSITTDITFVLSDGASGIDLTDLTAGENISVSNVNYTDKVTWVGDKDSITGTLDNSIFGPLSVDETVDIGIDTRDLSENDVIYTWSFTTGQTKATLNGATITLNGASISFE